MNKGAFSIISNLFQELKDFKDKSKLIEIQNVLNNEIPGIQCFKIIINDSQRVGAFYGMIVFPKLGLDTKKNITIKNYVVEIQQELLDILTPEELTAYLLHDISHNILTATVLERLKMGIFKSCKMSNTKVVDIMYNMDIPMRDLVIVDIANRTYKEPIVSGTDMYEPDRLLVDLGIEDFFNKALFKMTVDVDYLNVSNSEYQDIADVYITSKLIKMVREKLKDITKTYNELKAYIINSYDTKVLTIFPHINANVSEEQFGEKVSTIETMKPYELERLQEGVIQGIRTKSSDYQPTIFLEAVFNQKRPSASALQKELDIINFKMSSLESNYERLSVLDRIYDNIFTLEKYIEENPDDIQTKDFLTKFTLLTSILKDIKITKKQYGIFYEVPPGYEG